MKKMLILSAFLMATSSNAFAENIKCFLSVNSEPVAEVEFNLEANTKELFIDSTDYRFYLANKGNSKFELEVYDAYAPSRSYAIGYLRIAKDELSWAFWSRDILLETTCKLAQ